MKGVRISGKGADVNKVNLIAIQLEEEAGKGYKITSLKTEYRMEKDPRDGVDKRHVFLHVVVEKN